MNDDQLLSWIQECIRQDRFEFSDHALTKHPLIEGFRPQDAIIAILKQYSPLDRHHHVSSPRRCVGACISAPDFDLVAPVE